MYIVKYCSSIIGITDSREGAEYLVYNFVLDYYLNNSTEDRTSSGYIFQETLKTLALNKDIKALLLIAKSYEIIEIYINNKESLAKTYNDYVNAIDVKQIIK